MLTLNVKMHFKKRIVILGKTDVGIPLQAMAALPLAIGLSVPSKYIFHWGPKVV
jgi:hypothetical protein